MTNVEPASPAWDRITFETGNMGGRACLREPRITVTTVVSLVAEGIPTEEMLADHSELEPDDIRQVLGYAARLAREEVLPT
ncbi:MAG TPA: DUF433 domain-containing protein [Acetobacteraceae bacterium]|nr:DUF433 domain-containing protein [Acetobacteraceae bacterium]